MIASRTVVAVGLLALLAPRAPADPGSVPLARRAPSVQPSAGELPEIDRSVLLTLRRACSDISRQGESAALEALQGILVDLGDDPEQLAPFLVRWQRNLAQSKPSARKLIQISEELSQIALEFTMNPSWLQAKNSELEFAQIILRLDSNCDPAARILGRVRHDDRWITPEEMERADRKARIADLVRLAGRLEVPLERSFDDRGSTVDLFGAPIHRVSYNNLVHLRGPEDFGKLERVLRTALRGAALSRALLGEALEIPKLGEHDFLFPGSGARYQAALEDSFLNHGIEAWQYEAHDTLGLESYMDGRGWRTCKLRSEADYEALVLWDLMADWLPRSPQPCLVAGHLNWICLGLFGTKMPQSAIPPDAPGKSGAVLGTSADVADVQRRQGLWRAAQHGLVGCRKWLIQRVQEGQNPPWARSMMDHIGKIGGEPLLKATVVVEYLQDSGQLQRLFMDTRRALQRPEAFEKALGQPLPEFEEHWSRWLLAEGKPRERGVVQLLLERAQSIEAPKKKRGNSDVEDLVYDLQQIRSRALAGESPEFQNLIAYEDLSEGALAHANYLALHPEQIQRWPDAHEEYPDREGFSTAGSWAGLHSVIWPGRTEEALEAWMGTFYHRLPLLNPGLVGVGAASANNLVVLDTGSLVLAPWREHWVAWPADGERHVPRRFVHELPSPIPAAADRAWGFPITLQVHQPGALAELELSLVLWNMDNGRERVECYEITPQVPLNHDLVPSNAWCLIPKSPLESDTDYQFEARGSGTSRRWSFRTGE